MLRRGLAAIILFLLLLNSSGLPAIVAPYLVVFLAACFALCVIGMIFSAFSPDNAAEQNEKGRDIRGPTAAEALEGPQGIDPQIPSSHSEDETREPAGTGRGI